MAPVKPCDVCATPSTNTCSKCKSAFYCSVDHQKLFWGYHRLICGLDHEKFSFVPMPDFQLVEAKAIMTAFVLNKDDFPNGSEALVANFDQLKKAHKDGKDIDFKLFLDELNTKLRLLPTPYRLMHISWLRYQIYMRIKEEGFIEISTSSHYLIPFYSTAIFQQKIRESEGVTNHHSQYANEYFNSIVINVCKQFTSSFNILQLYSLITCKELSLKRLRKLYFQLKGNGEDPEGIYRNFTYVTTRSGSAEGSVDTEEKGKADVDAETAARIDKYLFDLDN